MSFRFFASAHGRRSLFLSSLTLLLATSSAPTPVQAADTIEPWARRAIDVETYVGYHGTQGARGSALIDSDFVFGRGITDRLSAYLAVDGTGARPLGNVRAGVFGTPLDTRHVDVDLLFTASVARWREYELTPEVEINLDRTPDHDTCGAYLRLALPVSAAAGRATAAYVLNPGAYVTIGKRHQVLLEWEAAMPAAHSAPEPAQHGLSLGYNLTLSPAFELINNLRFSLPAAGSPGHLTFTTGVIASLRGSGKE